MIRLRRRGRERVLHMPRHRIDEMHIVAADGEPARIPAGAAADVQNHSRRRREEALTTLRSQRAVMRSHSLLD